MSERRRNHHIPRFLLNRFASRVEGEKHWVWQLSRDAGPLELSTRDVAVSRSFYSGQADNVEDSLAPAEASFAAALAYMDEGQPPAAFADDLSQFAWTMAVRTRAIREQLAAALGMLLAEFDKWSSSPAALQYLRAGFNEELKDAIQKLPPQKRAEAMTAIRAPATHKLLLDYAESNFSGFVHILLDMIHSQGLATRSSKDGQVKALARVLDAGSAPDSFRPAAWHLFSRGNHDFVLGDSCVVAKTEDGSLGSLIKAIKDWREIYLPISPSQVLAATRTLTGPSLENAAINRASAKFALRYVYASRTGPQIEDLQPVIGTGEPLMSQARAAQIMQEVGTRMP